MKCCHLSTARAVISCKALRMRYQPSEFEVEEYCKTNNHRKCPFYLRGIVLMERTDRDKEPVFLGNGTHLYTPGK